MLYAKATIRSSPAAAAIQPSVSQQGNRRGQLGTDDHPRAFSKTVDELLAC